MRRLAAARKSPASRAHALFRNLACDSVSEWSTAPATLAHEPRIGPAAGFAAPARRRLDAPPAPRFIATVGAASSLDPVAATAARFRPVIAGEVAN